MGKTKKKKQKEQLKFIEEYNKFFNILGVNPNNIQHEWNNDGDYFKECTLYEDHPTPKLTTHTYNV